MKKGVFLLFLTLISWLSISWHVSSSWYRSTCYNIGDEESYCSCKAQDFKPENPIDQGIYQSCMAEVNVKKNEEENKKAEAEHKQAVLEEKIRKLEEKAKTTEEKVEAVVEKTVEKKMTQEEAEAFAGLKEKATTIESLVPIIKSKDFETQQKVNLILETFKASKDDYTRSVWIYLSYLLK